ncbi:hypothetical protein HNP84_003698 [Thermocatellispora tengchongensis]|uniref:DUF4352 domain-containing protein n=1 Tax=Thermocatellispora tengchongensis TaxID=1073253 RepID=A0A840P3N0_9ACTN|nr:DUF4190 domain-containing protein [Thermocatellispora tengchongensis]MBB5133972.1 hypothetical protein [Thermocatellispora tengchongensis]
MTYGTPPGYAPARRTNGLAIASLVLGLIGFISCGFTSVLAVIFGHVALGQIRRDRTDGHGMALAGTVLGWVLTGGWLLFWALWWAGFIGSIGVAALSAPTPTERVQLGELQPGVPTSAPPVIETALPEQEPPASEASEADEPAKLGGTITLAGLESDLQVAVTLERVVETATPANDFLKPSAGNRFYAVELVLHNKGQAPYSDSPLNGAVLIDAEGQQYRATIAEVREGVAFGGSVSMGAGDNRKGVIVFEVPAAAEIAKFQFALNSGFADQKGEWLTR